MTISPGKPVIQRPSYEGAAPTPLHGAARRTACRSHPGNRQSDRGTARDAGSPAHRATRRWPRPARGRAWAGEDTGGPHPGRDHRRWLSPDSVHARPAAGRPDRHDGLQPAQRRVHGAEGAGLRQHAAGRRDQPGSGQGAERAARGDAGEAGHHRRADAIRCPSRSWSWPRRTRSSRRAPIRCPRRRSIASCSS